MTTRRRARGWFATGTSHHGSSGLVAAGLARVDPGGGFPRLCVPDAADPPRSVPPRSEDGASGLAGARGLPLYPDWRAYPHVCNFYGPCYFLLVGGLGRAAGAGLDGLFFIGRGVTFAAALLTTAVLGGAVGRRHGPWAGLAAAAVSLGATPMIGFAVMVRSDLMAELLGLVGFLLSGRRSRGWCAVGCLLLVLAALTKQTAGVFLLARALALYASGRRAAPAPSWPVASACWGRSSRRSRSPRRRRSRARCWASRRPRSTSRTPSRSRGGSSCSARTCWPCP